MLEKFKKNADLIIIFLFYSVSYGLMLINEGVFWDDWIYFNQPYETRALFNSRAGVMPWINYLYVLSYDHGIIVGRIMTFFFFFISAYFLYEILRGIKEVDAGSRFFLTLFFAIVPVNFARLCVTMSFSAACYFLFFLGFWLLSKYLKSRNNILRILSLAALFFSFALATVLPFHAVIIAYIIYSGKDGSESFMNLIARSFRYLDFYLIPFLVLFLKLKLFSGDNTINVYPVRLIKIFTAPLAFQTSFIDVMDEMLRIFFDTPFMIIILSFLVYVVFKVFLPGEYWKNDKNNSETRLLLFGFYAFFFGVFAYVITDGKLPVFSDFRSRHQLLVPLGVCFILYYGLKIIMREFEFSVKTVMFVLSTITALFMVSNFSRFLLLERECFKQLSLIENIRGSEVIKNNTTFLFTDETGDNYSRELDVYANFYSYSGLMKLIFGNDGRFGAPSAKFLTMEEIRPFLGSFSNTGSYVLKEPEYEVIIKPGSFNLTNRKIVKLSFKKIFDSPKNPYKDDVKNILTLEYKKIEGVTRSKAVKSN